MQPIKQTDLKQFVADTCVAVDAKLDQLIPAETTEPARLHAAVRWSMFAGGKRFRPMLMLAVGEAFGADRASMLRTAAAIEMVHTYSLIHDDLPAMDDDDLRRGRETCHKKFDEATAILAGDVLQTLTFQAVAEDAALSADIRIRLVAEIARAAGTPQGMVAGQMLDLDAEGKAITAGELENIHRSKTGALIGVASRCGAIIAEASEKEIETVSDYAASLGLLFQITDDLLDVSADAGVLGKTPGKDARSEKSTYVSLHGVEKTRELARSVHAQAIAKLDTLHIDTSRLRQIADFVLDRES